MQEKQQLIATWTQALDHNAEQQLHAQGMLDAAILPDASGLANASEKMATVVGVMRGKVFICMMTLAFVVLGIWLALVGIEASMLYRLKKSMPMFFMPYEPPRIKNLDARGELLLYGGPPHADQAEQMRPLWESEPSNPAFYAEYVRHYLSEKSKLPPDFLETAARLDPDNGWFTELAAAVESKDAVKKLQGKAHSRSPVPSKETRGLTNEERRIEKRKIVTITEIKDASKAEKAMALWRKSLQQSKYENYEMEIHRLRAPYLKGRSSYIGQFTAVHYSPSYTSLKQRSLSDLVVAYLQKDDLTLEERLGLLRDCELYLKRLYSLETSDIVNELVYFAIAKNLIKNINVIAPQGIDPEFLSKMKTLSESFSSDDLIRLDQQRNDKNEAILKRSASTMAALTAPTVLQQSTTVAWPQAEELEPQRGAEQAYALRLIALVAMLVTFCFLPFNFLFRRRKPLLCLGQYAAATIDGKSKRALILMGVIMPLVYFFLLYFFTPLGGKELGMYYTHGLSPSVQAGSAFLLMIAVPRLLIHRYTAAWEKLNGSSRRWQQRLGWLAVGLILIPIHALVPMLELANSAGSSIDSVVIYSLVIGCTAPLVLWLIGNGLRGFFARAPYDRVMHAVRRQVMVSSMVIACWTICLSCALLFFQEMQWLKKDTFFGVHEDLRVMSSCEANAVKAMREETRALVFPEER